MVHEFAHWRYGVFNEYVDRYDPNSQPFYLDENDRVSKKTVQYLVKKKVNNLVKKVNLWSYVIQFLEYSCRNIKNETARNPAIMI